MSYFLTDWQRDVNDIARTIGGDSPPADLVAMIADIAAIKADVAAIKAAILQSRHVTVSQGANTSLTAEIYRLAYVIPVSGFDALLTGDKVEAGTIIKITCIAASGYAPSVTVNRTAVTLIDGIGYYTVGEEDVTIESTGEVE